MLQTDAVRIAETEFGGVANEYDDIVAAAAEEEEVMITARNIDKKGQERRITGMLLVTSFELIILTLPKWINLLIYSYINPYTSPQAFADFVFEYVASVD